ncbi:MAG: LapA family protein [Gammaproteobacteria bacterium]|nr:LapA family protein [Gammaproteobacteria bacterium]
MKLIKALLFVVVIILALMMGVLFSTRNSQAISLDLIFFQLAPTSVAVWLLLSLVLGMALSAFIYSFATLKLKRNNTKLQRQLRKFSQIQVSDKASR